MVHELEDCGHMIWMEQPAATLRILRQLAEG
jgi:pimeloyl-ACP methyl ester carboxylesterase